MQNFNEIWEDLNNLASNPKIRFISLFILFSLLLWGAVKACSTEEEEKKLYRIGRDSTWYPNNLYGKERNMLAFSDELLTEIAKNQKFSIELIPLASRSMFENLDRKSLDAVLSGQNSSSLSIGQYLYSQPFYFLGPVLVVNDDSPIKNLEEMNDRIIGVASNSPLVSQISSYNSVFRPYNNMLLALEDLSNDRIDGVVIDNVPAHLYTQTFYPGKMKILPTSFVEGIRMVVRKDTNNTDLINKFNEGLKQLKADGKYNELIKKWDLINTDPDSK